MARASKANVSARLAASFVGHVHELRHPLGQRGGVLVEEEGAMLAGHVVKPANAQAMAEPSTSMDSDASQL
jgi:hypothetical protein